MANIMKRKYQYNENNVISVSIIINNGNNVIMSIINNQ
jgi:hypothetical protein